MPRKLTTTQQGYGWSWQKLRVEAFRVYGHTCYLCGAHATTVDHLDPLMYGDRRVLPKIDRVRPCCLRCNSSRGARQGNALRRHGTPTTTTRRNSRRW